MPRHHALILTSIWDDEDFCALPAHAQRLYMLLSSQKRLSMVGVVPYSPRNWSRGCDETSVDDVLEALAVLIDHEYVLVDYDTDELLVRTILKHDPPRGDKSIRGMWNAFLEVDSKGLRRAIGRVIPADVWENDRVEPPEVAKPLRNAPSDDPPDAPSDAPCDGASLARASHRPPSTVHRVSPPAKSERDALWDALTASVGDATTKPARGIRGKAVRELLEVGATPDEIARRCKTYRRKWPRMDLTDTALVKHWDALAEGQRRNSADGVDADDGMRYAPGARA